MPYKIELERGAGKALAKIPRQDQERIIAAIDGLADEPRPHGCVPGAGHHSLPLPQRQPPGGFGPLLGRGPDAARVLLQLQRCPQLDLLDGRPVVPLDVGQSFQW